MATEARETNGDGEVDPADIPTDPQIQPDDQPGKPGMSGAPETPGGSSTPPPDEEDE